jgi:hypothetical protein
MRVWCNLLVVNSWICMGNWIGHTACNRYKEGEAQEEVR